MLYLDYLCTQHPFSVPASHLGHHVTFSQHTSLGSLWLWTGVCQMPLNWDLSDVLLMMRLG